MDRNQLKEMWLNLSVRDQRAVLIGALSLGVFLFYAVIWSPIRSWADANRQAVREQMNMLMYVKEAEATLSKVDSVALRKESVRSPIELMTFLKAKIDDFSLAAQLVSVRQSGDKGVLLSFKNASFDECLRFLISVLNIKKVEVERFSSTVSSEPGRVNVEMVIII